MKTYGYCRVSTGRQKIERQARNIKNVYPEAVIIAEEFTGSSMDRPKWNALFRNLHEGDTVVFDSVSRMSRNADEGFEIYETLFSKGVELVFLKQPYINTMVYRTALSKEIPLTNTSIDYVLNGINLYFMALAKEQIKMAFKEAENELQHIRQRTREGLESARIEGKTIGREKGSHVTSRKEEPVCRLIRKYSRDFDGSLNDSETMSLLSGTTVEIKDSNGKVREVPAGVSRNTYYKYKRKLSSIS